KSKWRATATRPAACWSSAPGTAWHCGLDRTEPGYCFWGARQWTGRATCSWNFVSSSGERIEQAKADWKAGRFGKVPGDEAEFIPLPEERVSMRSGAQHAGGGSPTS